MIGSKGIERKSNAIHCEKIYPDLFTNQNPANENFGMSSNHGRLGVKIGIKK